MKTACVMWHSEVLIANALPNVTLSFRCADRLKGSDCWCRSETELNDKPEELSVLSNSQGPRHDVAM